MILWEFPSVLYLNIPVISSMQMFLPVKQITIHQDSMVHWKEPQSQRFCFCAQLLVWTWGNHLTIWMVFKFLPLKNDVFGLGWPLRSPLLGLGLYASNPSKFATWVQPCLRAFLKHFFFYFERISMYGIQSANFVALLNSNKIVILFILKSYSDYYYYI